MVGLRVSGVTKRYGETPVLRGIDFEMSEGSIVALLGSSGSGKTTLLRLIAGFADPDEGTIHIGDRQVAGPGAYVPTEKRHVGYVPQEGALFPHLTVGQNVAFGLQYGRRDRLRIEEVLRITGLTGFEDRYPHQLSGGQQQRTALARALAPRPNVVLLDEPFNALDLDLRRHMAADVASALRNAGATAILVTHDPFEAFASADRIAAMVHGRIAQIDDPASLYQDPLNPRIARLTGPVIFMDAIIEGEMAQTPLGPIAAVLRDGVQNGPAQVMIRPEQLTVSADGSGPRGTVSRVIFNGDHYLASVEIDGLTLPVRVPGKVLPETGGTVALAVRGSCVAFPVGRRGR